MSEALLQQLGYLAKNFQFWINYDRSQRDKSGIETTNHSGIMLNGFQNAPPVWPSHEQLKNWIITLNESIETIQSLQEEYERLEQATKPFPMLAGIPITQTTAELIFEMYTALYGNQQSLEEIKSRGGFGWDEVKHITDNFIKRFGRQRYELLIKDK